MGIMNIATTNGVSQMENIIVLFLFAALTAGAQSTTQHLPVTDTEKIADAQRAGPHFITDDATILDWPAKKGTNFEFSVKV
jgi:hypothetical protein